MITRDQILVVAATERELAIPQGWRTLRCGVGPVDAAAATAAAIADDRPALILHVGIAGAWRHAKLEPPTLVIGSDSLYSDLHVPEVWSPRSIAAPQALIAAAERALPGAVVRSIATTGRVGGGWGAGSTNDEGSCDVEAMEGFGVLRAAQRASVPAIEVRAISNDVEEPDRSRWQFDAAFRAITTATPLLVAELLTCAP
jgi:nucleoside phosphorylase